MIITHTYNDPYIASRHGSTTKPTIEFEGTLKQCKDKMLDIYNECCGESNGFAENQSEAVRKSKGKMDGMDVGGRRVDYDSQTYRITTKKEMEEASNV